LHFGLYGFGKLLDRQFGGVGAMIEHPCLELEVTAADPFRCEGPAAQRVLEFSGRWALFHRRSSLPLCRLVVRQLPPEHSGLGVGTQLGLSVAAALNAWEGLPSATPAELAMSVARGLRSAVGTYGFAQGGLIAERGKLPHETISPLDVRVELPNQWRFVLVRAKTASGLAGQAEAQAFEQLPCVSPATSEQLIRLAREEMIPAAVQGNFDGFSEALYRYCREAGLCFTAIQGGPYNGPLLTRLVEILRACGATGVGQSSWGPTLFAVMSDEDRAQAFVERFRNQASGIECEIDITPPNNSGARITSHRSE
jgi:beta-ribofuranosylaminobenzene 5'-phosphate synthase